MSKRRHIPVSVKLAAALLTIVRPDRDGILRPVIPPAKAKKMTAKAIIACFEFDHVILHCWGGTDHASNLYPRPFVEHRLKTAKVDLPAIAKTRREAATTAKHRAAMLSKTGASGPTIITTKRKGKPMPGSRASKYKRHMDGRISYRD